MTRQVNRAKEASDKQGTTDEERTNSERHDEKN